MLNHTGPAQMMPDQRRAEVATILATGLQRLIRRGPRLSSDPPQKPDRNLRPPPDAAGEPLRFSFKVNHDDGGTMDLTAGRSIAEGKSNSFHPDWGPSAPVEVPFGWERP